MVIRNDKGLRNLAEALNMAFTVNITAVVQGSAMVDQDLCARFQFNLTVHPVGGTGNRLIAGQLTAYNEGGAFIQSHRHIFFQRQLHVDILTNRRIAETD